MKDKSIRSRKLTAQGFNGALIIKIMKKGILLFAFIITVAFSNKLKAQCTIIQEEVFTCWTETRTGYSYTTVLYIPIPFYYTYEVEVCIVTGCDDPIGLQ